ncbi:zf-TFIIB domain-containing protein [Paraburkholderia sp. J67]|uniref:TFIIB-type zinc ribbon-containing protein n=1 Tax=Paraburkholderia sp. J67 TaxID=2805435 RepID=UPI002ABE2B15|nr:zf-TFIIB domain-containing protein [Paraburkholderia sp. J67]
MKCPHCPDVTLAIAERHGVELDYCPQCRGVWLDRGELDRLIERAAQGQAHQGRQDHTARRLDDDYNDHRDERHGAHYRSRDYGHRQGSHERRRKSWLEDIFD